MGRIRSAHSDHGSDPMVLVCWLVVLMNLELTYITSPSGNYFEYQAFAIGSRSQAVKNYLERKFESFMESPRDNLIKDALFALRETIQGDKITSSICIIAIMGVGKAFHILDQETVQSLINEFEVVGEDTPTDEVVALDQAGDVDIGAAPPADQGAAPMDI